MFDAPINATASLIHFVYDNGTEVDYPPLHMHHAHLEKPEGGFYFSETHGDGRCYGRDGHSCYLQTMPKGYVFANVSGFETRCHVNSVGEARLRGVYYEIAVHNADATHTDKLRPLHAGILSVPPFLHKDLLGLKGYMVPTDKVTLSYGCTQFPKKARVVGAKWHTHGLMVHEILIFVATPHELGLDDDPAFAQQLYTSNETVPGVAKCGAFPKQGLLQRGPETPITMAEKIWDTRHQPDQKKMHPAFKSGYADLGAHGMTAQGTVEKLLAAHGDKLYTRLGPNSGRSENVNGTEFGRRTAVPLARHDFEAGEVLTVVAVNAKQPGAAGPMFDGGVDFLMHTALWMLFEMEGGGRGRGAGLRARKLWGGFWIGGRTGRHWDVFWSEFWYSRSGGRRERELGTCGASSAVP